MAHLVRHQHAASWGAGKEPFSRRPPPTAVWSSHSRLFTQSPLSRQQEGSRHTTRSRQPNSEKPASDHHQDRQRQQQQRPPIYEDGEDPLYNTLYDTRVYQLSRLEYALHFTLAAGLGYFLYNVSSAVIAIGRVLYHPLSPEHKDMLIPDEAFDNYFAIRRSSPSRFRQMLQSVFGMSVPDDPMSTPQGKSVANPYATLIDNLFIGMCLLSRAHDFHVEFVQAMGSYQPALEDLVVLFTEKWDIPHELVTRPDERFIVLPQPYHDTIHSIDPDEDEETRAHRKRHQQSFHQFSPADQYRIKLLRLLYTFTGTPLGITDRFELYFSGDYTEQYEMVEYALKSFDSILLGQVPVAPSDSGKAAQKRTRRGEKRSPPPTSLMTEDVRSKYDTCMEILSMLPEPEYSSGTGNTLSLRDAHGLSGLKIRMNYHWQRLKVKWNWKLPSKQKRKELRRLEHEFIQLEDNDMGQGVISRWIDYYKFKLISMASSQGQVYSTTTQQQQHGHRGDNSQADRSPGYRFPRWCVNMINRIRFLHLQYVNLQLVIAIQDMQPTLDEMSGYQARLEEFRETIEFLIDYDKNALKFYQVMDDHAAQEYQQELDQYRRSRDMYPLHRIQPPEKPVPTPLDQKQVEFLRRTIKAVDAFMDLYLPPPEEQAVFRPDKR